MRAISHPSTRQLLFGLPFVVAFVLLFWPTFVWMAERFDAHDSFYSHGWLIPLASGWLIWQRRERLKTCAPRASFQGLILLVPSLLIHTVATWWDVHFVSGFAMLGALGGLVWTLWGWQALWTLRFPMLFLLFMVPLPGVVLISVSFHMKLVAATLATHVLTFVGITARQAGSMIHVPGVSVVIDDTCSGLRSLISLIALSTLWTTLMPPSAKRWHKLTVVAGSIPIALATNLVRILVLVLLSAIYGTKVAEGFLHYGSGVVIFGIALLLLTWLSRSLVNRPQRPGGVLS
jgi:exosortase